MGGEGRGGEGEGSDTQLHSYMLQCGWSHLWLQVAEEVNVVQRQHLEKVVIG